MAGAIDDDAARSFAVGFYRALGNRRSVGNAVDQAVATLAAKGMPDEVLPRCLTRKGVDAHQVVLDLRSPSSSGSEGSAETGHRGPALAATQSPGLGAHTFVGRDRELALLKRLGELPAARVRFEQALASDRKTYGDNHPMAAIRRNNLAALLQQLGELPAARVLFEQALATLIAAYGDDHPTVALVRRNLANLIEAARPAPS